MTTNVKSLSGSQKLSMRGAAAWFFGLIIVTGVCFATVIPLGHTKESASGIWFGFTSEANSFYRLDLNERGGTLSVREVRSRSRVYRIDSWSISKGQLRFNISAISTNDYPILVNGRIDGGKLQLRIEPPDKGWVREVVAFREELIESEMKALRESMN